MCRPRLLLVVPLLLATSARAAPAKYYMRVHGVDEAAGVSSGIVEETKQLFIEALGRHPEVTMQPPVGLPEAPAAQSKWLMQHHLRAFEVTLKVLAVEKSLLPPPPGKQYRVLHRRIVLSVLGDSYPDKVLAIGGDGESEANQELGKQADVEKEGRQLMLDCTRSAISQAVDMTLTKLNLADKPVKAPPKKH